jgi:hypothetical protein
LPAVHDQAATFEPAWFDFALGLRHLPQFLDRGARNIRDTLNRPRIELALPNTQPSGALADTLATQHMTTAAHCPSALTVFRRHHLAVGSWIVLIAWLTSSAVAFWYFELSDWRPFAAAGMRTFASADAALVEQWFRSNIGLGSATGDPVKLTFIHLYNPQCSCNRFTEPHLRRLKERYQSRGVRFLAAPAPNSPTTVRAPLDLPLIGSKDGMLAAAGINTAPAALIFDNDGRLVYYGPYSDSAWCGSAGALVDGALERALSGTKAMTGASASRGCFCGW